MLRTGTSISAFVLRKLYDGLPVRRSNVVDFEGLPVRRTNVVDFDGLEVRRTGLLIDEVPAGCFQSSDIY